MSRKIEPFEYIWAESGDTTPAPTDEKIQEGYAGNEQPAKERFNHLQNRAENKIQSILVERASSTYEDAADAAMMLTTGQWGESWGCGDDALNKIAGTGAADYYDMAVYFDSDGNPRLLVLDNNASTIEVWDPRTLASVVITNDLHDDLPAAGATWQTISICTDGTDVFVVLTDTNAAPDTHIIQAWTIDETGADWAVKTGWPATGTALAGTGNGPNGTLKDAKVIIADDDYLAVSCGWTTVTAAGDPAIQLFERSDGTAVRDGAGDCPVGDSAQPCEGIASDGTNIFFATEGSANEYICSATIADLTAGCGGANYPLTTEGPSRLIACGPNLIVSMPWTAASAANVILRTHSATDADLDIILYGQNSKGSPDDGSKFTLYRPRAAAFDGINLYLFGALDITAAGDSQVAVICKIDASKFALVDVDVSRQLCDLNPSTFIVSPDDTLDTSGRKYYALVSDGRDVWTIMDHAVAKGLHRLPLAMLRS